MTAPNEKLEEQARRLDEILKELEMAVAHVKTAAAHFRSGEVPRGCAHTVALEGHMIVAGEFLKEISKTHRLAARP
ncbi:MAG: hypothetical protein IPK04_20560 [Bdellovibrionales bacterium]|jgi:hypothetical protein|nr:hypothetical protein [Bdellovibrionales bacterium]